jgi:cation:H+ antiporter
MISHLVLLLASLALLIKSADVLVEAAARLARRLGVSDLVVGLVITSIGTSLPEITASIAAALAGSPALAIGNVVGSNIANIGLVLGAAAVFRPFPTRPVMFDRDGYILIGSTVLLFGLSLNNRIGRLEALLLLLVYLGYVLFAARTERDAGAHRFKDFLAYMFAFEYARPLVSAVSRGGRSERASARGEGEDERHGFRDGALLVGSLVVLIASARFVVAESIWVARAFSVPENLIGLSILAIGTSLPELLVGLSAARRGKPEIVLGNVMGSNVANLLLILGATGLLHPLDVPEMSVVYTMPIMIFFTLGLLHVMRRGGSIRRGHGVIALTAYVAFLVTAFVQGWG